MLKKIALTLVTLIVFCGYGHAQQAVRDGHVQAQIVSETQSIEPGHPFWVGVFLQMDPDWHVYWENAGDSGLPVKVQWSLPDHFQAGPLHWPYPKRIVALPLTSYG